MSKSGDYNNKIVQLNKQSTKYRIETLTGATCQYQY